MTGQLELTWLEWHRIDVGKAHVHNAHGEWAKTLLDEREVGRVLLSDGDVGWPMCAQSEEPLAATGAHVEYGRRLLHVRGGPLCVRPRRVLGDNEAPYVREVPADKRPLLLLPPVLEQL